MMLAPQIEPMPCNVTIVMADIEIIGVIAKGARYRYSLLAAVTTAIA